VVGTAQRANGESILGYSRNKLVVLFW